MKKITLVLSVIILAISLNSCKYECPCFDKSLLAWIPQEYGDEIKFANQNNDTIVFIVNKKSYTDSYEIERQNKQSCGAYAVLNAFNKVLIKGYIIEFSKLYKENQNIVGNLALDANKSGGFMLKISDISTLTQIYSINNKNYTALVFENDTTIIDNEIYKIVLAENYGLLKFYEKSGIEWTLIEE